MKKVIIWITVLIFLGAACWFAYSAYERFWVTPYKNAISAMPDDATLTVELEPSGNLRLHWPKAKIAQYYCVEVQLPPEPASEGEKPETKVLFRDYVQGTSCLLPQIMDGREIVIEVSSIVEYETPKEILRRKGDNPIRVTTVLNKPYMTDLSWQIDPETDIVSVSYGLVDANLCRIYLKNPDESLTLLRSLSETDTQFSFGEGLDIPMPPRGETCTFVFDTCRIVDGIAFYGLIGGEFSVVREDLLGRELHFTVTDLGNNVFNMTWDETKGDCYVLQQYNAKEEQWETLQEYSQEDERSYTTGHLKNLSEFQFRLQAQGGQTLPDSDAATEWEYGNVTTVASPVYCTIWPTKSLEAYSAPTGGEVVGNVKTARAYCVLDMQEGMFAVRLDGKVCWIDSNYCMINLPELIGDLCSYNITNSYESIYMVHEYEIPEVTGVVTAGYEAVEMSNGKYLVPLLYPTSHKLLAAAQAALEQGYRLKIYDSFRPQKATKEIYELTQKVLELPIPEQQYTEKELDDMPQLPEGEILTYLMLMTNNEWALNHFLAAGASRHNLGVALDLTLESLSGREVEMASSIHDLSWYSVPRHDDKNAKKLAQIMKGVGFGGLTSEWWHFQDNEATENLSPPAVWSGVTPECWMADDHGWRYRRYNGKYFTDCVKTIEGVEYTFDENGYVVQ